MKRPVITALLVTSLSLSPVAADELPVESPITPEDREHWSFLPLQRPPIPQIESPQAQNSVDMFVLARLQSRGLTLTDPAPRSVLARRLCFDLTGLPSTHDTILRNAPPRSVRQLIARLMASPAYGERWAQHWLDLARFAETDGFEHDKVRGEAWQYRDWTIAAWNQWLPYDQFVRQQLAGDRQDNGTPVATMFCTSGPDMPDINSQAERRHELLNEMTSTVGAVMLGLQIGCAQCHDHKYDPLSQADFYRLRAMFEDGVHVVRNRSVGPLQSQPNKAPARVWVRGDWRRPGPVVAPAAPRVVNLKDTVVADRLKLVNWLFQSDHPLTARVIVNRLWQQHFGRGLVTTPSDFGVMGDPPTHPHLLDHLAAELVDSGWRLQHVQRLIIESATYQQASRLPEDASLSQRAAWRHKLDRDPRNDLLSRFERKRLDGEAVRDAMLAASDTLNRCMGGPGIRPPLAPELIGTLLKNQWNVSPKVEHYRRSIYVFARRNLRYPIFEVLDRPDANASCPQRPRTTTAPQALLLLNSPLSLDAARRLAGWIAEREDTPADYVRAAFQRALSRDPLAPEMRDSLQFLREYAGFSGRDNALAAPLPAALDMDSVDGAALTALCLALLNCNEFLYLD